MGVRARVSPSQPANQSAAYISENSLVAISLMSAPAANALGEPESRIAPISGSVSSSCTAATTARIVASFSAFRAFGRFRRMWPTRPCRSTMIGDSAPSGVVCSLMPRSCPCVMLGCPR